MDTRPLQQSVRSSRGSAEETTARANEEADPNIEDLPEPKHAAWEATVVDCDKEKDEEDREQGEKDKSAFAAARKGHYNEMALVRQMMAARALEEDEDDSDDEDEEQEAEAEEEEDTAELESSVAANNGGWAAGPDALHGLPKAAAGGATSIPVYSKVRELSTSPDLESSVIVPDPLRCSYVVKNDRRQKHVAWDEATLAEHDLERGTRQKNRGAQHSMDGFATDVQRKLSRTCWYSRRALGAFRGHGWHHLTDAIGAGRCRHAGKTASLVPQRKA